MEIVASAPELDRQGRWITESARDVAHRVARVLLHRAWADRPVGDEDGREPRGDDGELREADEVNAEGEAARRRSRIDTG